MLAVSGCDLVLGLERNDVPRDGDAKEDADAEADAPAKPACFRDDFVSPSTTPDGTRWGTDLDTAAIQMRVVGDYLSVEFVPGETGSESLVSQSTFDFTNATLTAHVRQAPTATNTRTSFGLRTSSNVRLYALDLTPGRVTCRDATGPQCSVGFSAMNHEYLRLEHASGSLIFESSADGITFNMLKVIDVLEPLNEVVFFIEGAVTMTITAASEARWDGIFFENATCNATSP